MIGLRAVVWGASGGIGRALVEALAASGACAVIHAGARQPVEFGGGTVRPFKFDLLDENSIVAASQAIASDGAIDMAIVATGMLHEVAGAQPEKSFAALSAASMIDLFRVNTIGPALIAKHMMPIMTKERRSVFAALSARVGSIGDNRLGGWHSYRASKAALNMMIVNLAIELHRTRPLAIAVGLHPGTVRTNLSAPFQRGVAEGKLFTPEMSAAYLLSAIAALTPANSGSLVAWDGQRISY